MLNRMMTSFEEPGRRLATALLNTKPATEQEKWLIKSQEHLEVLERQRLHWLQLQLAGLKHPTEAKSSDPQLPRLYALARCMEWDESDASRAALDYFIPRSHSMTALKALGGAFDTHIHTHIHNNGKSWKEEKGEEEEEEEEEYLSSSSFSFSFCFFIGVVASLRRSLSELFGESTKTAPEELSPSIYPRYCRVRGRPGTDIFESRRRGNQSSR